MPFRVNQVQDWSSVDSKYWKPFLRTNQDVLCECGQPLWRHGQPLKEACPTMIQDCAGRWWKT